MAIVLVQSNKALTNSSTTSQAVQFLSNTATGNLIVVAVGTITGATNSVASITDSQSNSYQLAIRAINGPSAMVEIWYATNITGGTTPTVTATLGSMRPMMTICEYSGLTTTSPLDQTLGSSGNAPNLSVGPSGTTGVASELVFAAATTNDSGNTYTAGAGFGNLSQQRATTTGNQATEDKTVSSVGTQTATLTLSGASTAYAMALATFAGASGGGGTGGKNLMLMGVG